MTLTNQQVWFAVQRLQAMFNDNVREVRYIDSLFHKRFQNTEFVEWIDRLFKTHLNDLHVNHGIKYSERDIYRYYYALIRFQVNREYVRRVYEDDAVQREIEWIKDILFRSADLCYMAFDANYE